MWDHSFGFDKKIGERILPLRGVVDSQGLFCRLVYDDGEKRIPGGVIQGSVNFASCPRYMQQGDFGLFCFVSFLPLWLHSVFFPYPFCFGIKDISLRQLWDHLF